MKDYNKVIVLIKENTNIKIKTDSKVSSNIIELINNFVKIAVEYTEDKNIQKVIHKNLLYMRFLQSENEICFECKYVKLNSKLITQLEPIINELNKIYT